jgi:hypothetical protein
VSAITGLAGTGASFAADIARDGFQAKDLGNLGLGLLFDVASLIPYAGTAAAVGGVVNKLRKGLPVLIKLAGIAGVGSSLSLAVNKIQSGEKLTMKDLRIIMNGVLGAYTLSKQGIDVTNSRKKAGVEANDVDIHKMHMEDIDASNLSDGQKAAMKQFFDPDPNTSVGNRYRDALDPEQQKIFDQFISDGGDETALKMMIGDNELFKTLRADRELLERVSKSLTTGEKLSSDDFKRYNELIQESGLRTRLGTEAYHNMRNLDADNDALANALRTVEDPKLSHTDQR